MKNQHNLIKLLLRIIGLAALIAGITLSIIGFANFGNFDNNLFSLTIIGLPCIGIGIGITVFSFSQGIARYVKNEHAPIINELSEDISPAVKNYASAVKDEILADDSVTCNCGNKNHKDAKFCSSCGTSLLVVCPNCNKRMSADSNFCDECGTKIDI